MQQTTQPLHDCVFMQISESQCGRAIRTDRFKYAVRTLAPTGYLKYNAGVYFEDYLYDLEKDPIERYFQCAATPYSAVWCISHVRICTSNGMPCEPMTVVCRD